MTVVTIQMLNIIPDFRNKKEKMVLNLRTCDLASF
jgi:hypothetical protein